MKHFKVVGPETTREFDIEDDEMLHWQILKIIDYEKKVPNPKQYPIQNDVITNNKEQS